MAEVPGGDQWRNAVQGRSAAQTPGFDQRRATTSKPRGSPRPRRPLTYRALDPYSAHSN